MARYVIRVIGDFLVIMVFEHKKSQWLTTKEFKTEILDCFVHVVNEVHYTFPNIGFKEVVLGKILQNSSLFIPRYSNQMKSLGIKTLKEGYREDPSETTKRLIKLARIFAGLLSDDAYIGRLW